MDGFGKILVRSFGSTPENILEAKTFSLQNRNRLVLELTNKVNDFGLFGFADFQCFKAMLLARYKNLIPPLFE
jgi:hypothetical protein